MRQAWYKKMKDSRFRYLCVMGLGWLVDLAAFALFAQWLSIPLSQIIARLSGAAVGFAGHKWFSFSNGKTSSGRTARQSAVFALVWLFSYLLTTGGILFLVQKLGFEKLTAKILIEILVVPINYVMLSRWVFSHRSSSEIK
jgi:putative flippase GtrA